MKIVKKLILSLFISYSAFAGTIYDFKIKGAKGETLDFNSFKGKPILIVNIATRCGYTGQLEGLENIYQKYKKKNLVVLGVPSNDFGGQTPEGDEDVVKFCKRSYGVNFPLTTKMVVTGDKKADVIKHIIGKSTHDQIKWNFEKFLFNKEGRLVKSFRSSTTPESKELKSAIDGVI